MNKPAWNKGLTKKDHPSILSAAQKTSRLMTGKQGRKHSEFTKELIRDRALASNHRRLRRGIVEYTRLDGSIVSLDSSWELALAKRLDELKIRWERPDSISYVASDGRTRRYFPDFYLPDHNLYLDPKNPFAIKAQQDKINQLTKQIKNLIIIKELDDCKNFNLK
jgi:hypothetical protein